MVNYIHQLVEWPHFFWNNAILDPLLQQLHVKQSRLLGRMEALGFALRAEANVETLTQDVLKSSEIEGQVLDALQVRSSIARKLGIEISGLVPADRHVEGIVEMMIDATTHFETALTNERLFGWQAALFPTGYSGLYKIQVGTWRKNTLNDPMQVVSGSMGKERVHFEAPAAMLLEKEMNQFFEWFNNNKLMDSLLKAAIAHFWFVTIHPFDDGNGRIARAIADMQLSRADGSSLRFYSMSTQIRKERSDYYFILEQTQKGSLDITIWLQWFLGCLERAYEATGSILSGVLYKANFWKRHATTSLNKRQYAIINKLLDGFEGKLSTSKYAKITKCSQDTALRDINDMIQKKVFIKTEAIGRNTSYELSAE
jgi:Fic family protein